MRKYPTKKCLCIDCSEPIWGKDHPRCNSCAQINRWGSITDRFFRKIEKTSHCWNWFGAVYPNGYGAFRVGREGYAHRISWEIHRGKIPYKMNVLHHCDNRKCVNPEHLFIGTAKDNAQDCIRKGRFPMGERTYCSKLTEKEIKEIRDLYPMFFQREIGRIYGIGQSQVGRIIKKIRWKHILSQK